MRIAIIGPTYAASLASAEAMLTKFFHPRELLRVLHGENRQVSWIQGFTHTDHLQVNQSSLHLIRAEPFRGGIESLMASHLDETRLRPLLQEISPDIIHVMGILPADIGIIHASRNPGCRFLSASYHGGQPAEIHEYRELQNRAFATLDAIFFNTEDSISVWRNAGMVRPGLDIRICPETSSFFSRSDRIISRLGTGLTGNPVCVCSSRLHPVKDPVTVIEGFRLVLDSKPDARLYWVFQTGEMLDQIEALLDEDRRLQDAIHLIGGLEYGEMEGFFNSADFFIQASSREIGGNSLVEAMACGVIPVVSDIPSFRSLTGNDRFKTLFAVGDAQGLADIIRSVPEASYPVLSRRVQEHFMENLSFECIARVMLDTWPTQESHCRN